ncbi:MAG: D-alanyl-D-alanine carboxypeptidase [Firmicutes bacterium]|nr:D-alanyl-D-alanine carboxypeptidase [Bacillota bacterium]
MPPGTRAGRPKPRDLMGERRKRRAGSPIQGPGSAVYGRRIPEHLPGSGGLFAGMAVVMGILLVMIFAGKGVLAAQFDVGAKAAILMDASTGQVLFSKNAREKRPPASITKIMTVLVAMDAVKSGDASLTDKVSVSPAASRLGGSQAFLDPREQFTLEQMLKAITIGSANDAALAVAQHVAGTEAAFVESMNLKAQELGMTDTTFGNPHGLPPEDGAQGDITSARDVAVMTRALVSDHPEVLKWTSTRQDTLREEPRQFTLMNRNRLLSLYSGADGVKTGYTEEAGYCLSATAKRDKTRLISVVLGADSDQARVEQSIGLLDLGFRGFKPVVLAAATETVDTVKVRTGIPENVPVVAKKELRILVPRGRPGVKAERRVELQRNLQAPLREGQVLGKLVGALDGRKVSESPLVAGVPVRRAGVFRLAFRWVRDLVLSVFR